MRNALVGLGFVTAILLAFGCAHTTGLDQDRWIKSEAASPEKFPDLGHVAILCVTNRTASDAATTGAGAVWRALHDSLSWSFTPSQEFAQDCRRRGRESEHRNLCEAWRKNNHLSPRLVRLVLSESLEDGLLAGEIREWQQHRVEVRLDLYSAEGACIWSASGSQSGPGELSVSSDQTISVVADSTGRRSIRRSTSTITESQGYAIEALADALARALVGTIPASNR